MLQERNSVVNTYRIRLTSPLILNNLSPNKANRLRAFAVKAARPVSVLLGVLALGLAGCANVDSRPDPEVLKERAQARWNALVSGDLGKAYGFLSPTTRAAMTPASYADGVRKGFWKSATVDKVQCESATVCDAYLTVEYAHLGRTTKTPMKETWIKDGSTWWFVQK
jgi:hypothetical protein